RLVGRLGVMHDITEKKRLEDQLRHSQKLEAVGRLAGGVAHDFNNLLAVIMGYSDLIRVNARKSDRLARDIEEIRRASERGASLTQQLLAFSRGQLLQPQVVEVNALVGAMADMLRRVIGEDIELELQLDPEAGCVTGDPGQLEQVVLNLVLNARDAMARGGRLTLETARVDLDVRHVEHHAGAGLGPHVRLTVRDTGCGMPPEVMAHLFEPFFTTKEPGRGTGLGLSTVYGIVKQHGGHVEVDSQPGQGSTFRVHLPRVDAEPEPQRPAATGKARPRGTETVLVVEDEGALRDLIGRILGHRGYTILPAGDGEEALALAVKHPEPIQLLVTDLVMPRMGGFELAARVRGAHPETRVLYLSGYSTETLEERADVGADAVLLQKPFTPDALLRTVREVLDRPDVRPAR